MRAPGAAATPAHGSSAKRRLRLRLAPNQPFQRVCASSYTVAATVSVENTSITSPTLMSA